jgi:hypothetical protein
MNAESSRVLQTDMWTEWENHIVNRTYPLRRFLGGSVHSGVFLTEFRADRVFEAAIKLVPAERIQTEDQLMLWGTAATLAHPHLLRFFDVGRCQLRGRPFLFVVMEYAEQTLAQLLPRRALSVDEVLELLPPTFDALAFLHRNYLVHGQVKPSNFLVVNDQVKLASDTLRPVGNTSGQARASLYDPPELKDGVISPAGDVWALGITLVQALTQRPPAWLDDRSEKLSLPVALPPQFVDIARRCLSRAPVNRPTVLELEELCKPAPPPPAHVVSAPQSPAPAEEQPHAPHAPAAAALEAAAPTVGAPKSALGPLVLVTVLVLAVAGWVGWKVFHTHSETDRSIADAAQVDSQSAPASAAGEQIASLTRAAGSTGSADTDPGVSPSPVAGSAGAVQPVRESPASATPASTAPVAAAPVAATPVAATPIAATPVAATPASASPASTPSASATPASVPPTSAPGASGPAASESPASRLRASRSATPESATSGAAASGSTGSGAGASRLASWGSPASAGGSRPAGSASAAAAQTVSSRVSANSIVARAAGTSPANTSNPPGATRAPAVEQTGAANSSHTILYKVVPAVPPDILVKIHGHVNVRVRVLVDPSGDVVGQFLESAGPSRYFARVAGDAAGGWKFAPEEGRGSRVWLLQFEFTPDGINTLASAAP